MKKLNACAASKLPEIKVFVAGIGADIMSTILEEDVLQCLASVSSDRGPSLVFVDKDGEAYIELLNEVAGDMFYIPHQKGE